MTAAADLLRPGVLAGRSVHVAGAGELGEAAAAACRSLGARVERDQLPDPLDVLVVDGASGFDGGGLRGAADAAWATVRAAATERMIAAGNGTVVLLAPRPRDGAHAGATRAALENLARTLSIEWARHNVRAVAVHPGPATAPEAVAALVAFLASPAGEYYSGCCFSLGESG